ncbi:Zinc finger protein 793 [Camelus dromedarius]|uniref:Zinc finger protein 793 n=1 Tax=Camelus dromedarius TaxID=9838 RepID=A0A5N4DUT5_CAMDR|nr:Zinc finger protein 793 [Camelus dromedarius]
MISIVTWLPRHYFQARPVSFKDVVVGFIKGVHRLNPAQRGSTGCDAGDLQQPRLSGYEGTKPYVILRLEQEEAPWVCEAACPGATV